MLVDPYPSDSETKPFGYQSVAYLLQNQLRLEESNDWPLKCIPRIYKSAAVAVEGENGVKEATKHALPALTVPVPVDVAKKPLFPDTYFTVYGDQEIAVSPIMSSIQALQTDLCRPPQTQPMSPQLSSAMSLPIPSISSTSTATSARVS